MSGMPELGLEILGWGTQQFLYGRGREAAVAAQGLDDRQSALVGPSRDGPGIDMEEPRDFTWREQFLGMQVGPGIAPRAHLCVSQSQPLELTWPR